jgi:hypothetical protein
VPRVVRLRFNFLHILTFLIDELESGEMFFGGGVCVVWQENFQTIHGIYNNTLASCRFDKY